MRIDPLDHLAVKLEHQTQHPMRRRMLRPEVDREVASRGVRSWRNANGEWRMANCGRNQNQPFLVFSCSERMSVGIIFPKASQPRSSSSMPPFPVTPTRSASIKCVSSSFSEPWAMRRC